MTDTAEPTPRSDYDSPWKEALEGYFPEFLALLWQIEKKFGETSARALLVRVESANSDTLRLWSERILTADTPDALFH